MARNPRTVTSAKNPAVQRFRDAAAGRSEGVMLAEGVRLVWDAVRAGAQVIEAAVSPKLTDIELRDALAERAESFLDCSDALLARLSALDTPQGVAVRLRRPQYDDAALLGEELAPLVVVAAGLRDPGNLGAVLRAAEAAGATGCLTIEGGADPFRDKAVRGSMGSIFRLPVRHGMTAADAIAFARHHRLQIVVADGGGSHAHTQVDLRRPLLLVVGAEAAGVGTEWLAAADEHVRIPLRPPVESLNVAVAAGVLLFEAQRQRVEA
ncbi:MAG: RNA methyltransferase [Planctomycetes bacterium]|nr:RNA methyltransferase [Planctomycetota bacterium]